MVGCVFRAAYTFFDALDLAAERTTSSLLSMSWAALETVHTSASSVSREAPRPPVSIEEVRVDIVRDVGYDSLEVSAASV